MMTDRALSSVFLALPLEDDEKEKKLPDNAHAGGIFVGVKTVTKFLLISVRDMPHKCMFYFFATS